VGNKINDLLSVASADTVRSIWYSLHTNIPWDRTCKLAWASQVFVWVRKNGSNTLQNSSKWQCICLLTFFLLCVILSRNICFEPSHFMGVIVFYQHCLALQATTPVHVGMGHSAATVYIISKLTGNDIW